MKKLYNIQGYEFGIDFDSVLCFYLDGKIDTYHGLHTRYLNILIGGKYGEPTKITQTYSEYTWCSTSGGSGYEEMVLKNMDNLYNDLIEYFKNEKE